MSVLFRAAKELQRSTRLVVEDFLRLVGISGDPYSRISPAFAVAGVASSKNSQASTDPLIWDGVLLAGGLGGCPKFKLGLEKRRKKKRDIRRFYPHIRSWHMLVPCDSCGELRKKYHLCETCYDQTRYETQKVREKLKEAGLDLNQETVLRYKDDNGRFKFGQDKQIFTMERKRPAGWFSDSFWGK